MKKQKCGAMILRLPAKLLIHHGTNGNNTEHQPLSKRYFSQVKGLKILKTPVEVNWLRPRKCDPGVPVASLSMCDKPAEKNSH
jgi:hypothetical protein